MKNVCFSYPNTKVEVLKSLNLELQQGEILGLVGESGCGKSTLAKIVAGLEFPDSGSLSLAGQSLDWQNSKCQKQFRQKVQMIFQDPLASLNPKWTLEQSILEPLHSNKSLNKSDKLAMLHQLAAAVELDANEFHKYPHEFSGGQLQRVGIARAIIASPELLICDEIVSSLDVSIQTQILNLLKKIWHEKQMSMLFISHDLGVVRHFCHRVLVMYFGNIVEVATPEILFSRPQHPYTRSLLASIPSQSLQKIVASQDDLNWVVKNKHQDFYSKPIKEVNADHWVAIT